MSNGYLTALLEKLTILLQQVDLLLLHAFLQTRIYSVILYFSASVMLDAFRCLLHSKLGQHNRLVFNVVFEVHHVQSLIEASVRQNLAIFVTAKIVSNIISL